MGSDQERTGDTVGSDGVEIGSEGDAAEPASDAAADAASDAAPATGQGPDTVQGVVAAPASGDGNTTQEAAPEEAEVEGKKKRRTRKRIQGWGRLEE